MNTSAPRSLWRRVRRGWNHPDRALRIVFRFWLCMLVVTVTTLILSCASLAQNTRDDVAFEFMTFAFFALTLSTWMTFFFRHIRRARRMMGGDPGLITTMGWALVNGDAAIRVGYAGLLALITLLAYLTLSPGWNWRHPDSLLNSIILLLSTALCLQAGHLGIGRRLASLRPLRPWYRGMGKQIVMLLIVISIAFVLPFLIAAGEDGGERLMLLEFLGAIFLIATVLGLITFTVLWKLIGAYFARWTELRKLLKNRPRPASPTAASPEGSA